MNIERQLALIPLAQLNTVLISNGVAPQTDKNIAVEQASILVNTGKVTLDQVRQSRATGATQVASSAQIPDDIRKKIINATAEVAQSRADVERLNNQVSSLVGQVSGENLAMRDAFEKLSKNLNAKVSALQGVDYALVKNSIQIGRAHV